jgi:hypothetical protein
VKGSGSMAHHVERPADVEAFLARAGDQWAFDQA